MRVRSILLTMLFAVTLITATNLPSECKAQQPGQPANWHNYYYYPYVYYPHNFQNNTGSFDHLYYRYPQAQQIPVYNKGWYNFYPTEKPWYKGSHFRMDVF